MNNTQWHFTAFNCTYIFTWEVWRRLKNKDKIKNKVDFERL